MQPYMALIYAYAQTEPNNETEPNNVNKIYKSQF